MKRKYALATGAGIFFDDETGLKVLPGKTVSVDKDTAGRKTQQAIMSRGLVEVAEETKAVSKSNETIKTDLPEDFPGRDVLVKEGVGLKEINQIPEAEREQKLMDISGIGKATVGKFLEYLKK